MNKKLSASTLSYEKVFKLIKPIKTLVKCGAEIYHFGETARAHVARREDQVLTESCACSKRNLRVTQEKQVTARTFQPNDLALEHESSGAWEDIVQKALATHYRMRKTIRSAKTIVNALDSNFSVEGLEKPNIKERLHNEKTRADLYRLLCSNGIPYEIISSAIEAFDNQNVEQLLHAALKDFVALTDAYGKSVRKRWLRRQSLADERDAMGSTNEGLSLTIDCSWLPGPAYVVCAVVAIIIIVVGAFLAIGEAVAELFNATDDDNARNHINHNSCETLVSVSISQKIDWLSSILSGPTGDDDERAILRLFSCIPCEQVSELVNHIGLTTVLNEFHGFEWNRLVIRLRECGLLNISDWDDDATRIFINDSDCSTVDSLSLTEINQLIRNLFSGACGDDDEQAIIKLIGCLPCSRRISLSSMPGTAFSDFRDSFDGEEWDQIRALFEQCRGEGTTRKFDEEGELVSDRPDTRERGPREPR